jgi:inosine-uridine nucleoside N-ribohydrolase
MFDPEAARIVLTADFPRVTVAGNVANSIYPDQDWLDGVSEVDNSYTRWSRAHLPLQLPFWDSIAAAIMVEPSIVLNATNCKRLVPFVFLHGLKRRLRPTDPVSR